ncbi:MAG: LysR substrate-binding domain-containing protein [Rhodocyclaceae bacterium]
MTETLNTISLRRLQVFLVVCDTLHMARAAERLGVAQPALSQQIQSLERALDVQLFHRRKRGIDLTAAGHACRAEARRLLAQHATLVDTVQRTARGETGHVSLGYVGSSMFEGLFPSQLQAMRQRYPDIALSLREDNVATLLADVRAGTLEAALVRAPVRLAAPLCHRVHSAQELVVVLPAAHALAHAPALSMTQLAPLPMIGLPDSDTAGIMLIAAQWAAAAGTRLNVAWKVSDVGSALGLVAAGLGYAIVPKGLALLAGPAIVTRPLADAGAISELWLVWHEERLTPALERFLRIASPADTG